MCVGRIGTYISYVIEYPLKIDKTFIILNVYSVDRELR